MLFRKGTLLGLASASCVAAFLTVAPSEAAAKPCCYNDGRYYEASSRTCYRYGGEVVSQRYCRRYGYDGYYDGYRRGPDVNFSIRLGDVWIAYSDGYYDRHRRWHRWGSNRERDWYRRHHGRNYRHMKRDHDHDRRRRWRDRD